MEKPGEVIQATANMQTIALIKNKMKDVGMTNTLTVFDNLEKMLGNSTAALFRDANNPKDTTSIDNTTSAFNAIFRARAPELATPISEDEWKTLNLPWTLTKANQSYGNFLKELKSEKKGLPGDLIYLDGHIDKRKVNREQAYIDGETYFLETKINHPNYKNIKLAHDVITNLNLVLTYRHMNIPMTLANPNLSERDKLDKLNEIYSLTIETYNKAISSLSSIEDKKMKKEMIK